MVDAASTNPRFPRVGGVAVNWRSPGRLQRPGSGRLPPPLTPVVSRWFPRVGGVAVTGPLASGPGRDDSLVLNAIADKARSRSFFELE